MKINPNIHRSTQLSDFDIKEPLGRGSNSYVYRAYCRKNSKNVAIKVIDKRNGRKVKQEVQLQKQSKHKSIIDIIDFFDDERNHYIVLEYCAEGELYAYLKKKAKLCEEEATGLLIQLTQATEVIHSRGIIHRDLKLGNVLLASPKILKVGDFGLAENFDLQQNRHQRHLILSQMEKNK